MKPSADKVAEGIKNEKISAEVEAARVEKGAVESVKNGLSIAEFISIEIAAMEKDEDEATIRKAAVDAYRKVMRN